MHDIYDQMNKNINHQFRRSCYYPFPRNLCFPEEIPILKKWAQGKRSLVEIGVFEGCSARAIRSVMHDEATLHLIDPFVCDSMNKELKARRWMAWLNISLIKRGHIMWHRDYSHRVVKKWNQEIDFIFIDGDHSEESCFFDWVEWSPFVTRGGVIIFHDARYGVSDGKYWDGWEGPTNVVKKLFKSSNRIVGWEIVDEVGTVVVVKRS